jgi:CRISPR-associated protein Cmr4
MVMDSVLLYLYAESPIHAGGSDSLGTIDLPIQRESTTGLPVIWGQSLKGALRERARKAWGPGDPPVTDVFGSEPPGSRSDAGTTGGPSNPDGPEASEAGGTGRADEATAGDAAGGAELRPGSLQVGDAQLVAFPVPTLRNCFAWATSPLVMSRLARKLSLADAAPLGAIPAVSAGAGLAAHAGWASPRQVFGPFVLPCAYDGGVAMLGDRLARDVFPADEVFTPFRSKATTDTVLLDDGALAALTAECTEVTARVQLEPDAKTVAPGSLFYSENIPAETVLAALLASSNTKHLAAVAAMLDGKVLRIGGDETIGKGLAWCRVVGPSSAGSHSGNGGADSNGSHSGGSTDSVSGRASGGSTDSGGSGDGGD